MSRPMQEEDDLAQDQREALTVFQSFLEQNHREEIHSILAAATTSEHFSLDVNALEFFDTNVHVGQFLLKQPVQFLPVFEQALKNAQTALLESNFINPQVNLNFKEHVHVRFTNLPVCPELTRVNIPKSEDIGFFLAISGNNSSTFKGLPGKWFG